MSQPADDTRHRLLEAAGEVFADKGFRAATVREICDRAGANLGAVNYYFRDKETLYVEVIKHVHHSEEEPDLEWNPDTPPEAKLRDYLRQMLTRILDQPRPAWHSRLMIREMAEPTQACGPFVHSFLRARYELLGSILAELLPPETPVEERHLAAFCIVGQALHFKFLKSIGPLLVGEQEYRTYDVDRLADYVTRFSLAALRHLRPGQGGTRTESPN